MQLEQSLVNQQLGPLRSEIVLVLHTQYAAKLWKGREEVKNEKGKVTQPAIMSMPICLSIITQIQRDSASDDPYADDYLLKLEEKLIDAKNEMKSITDRMLEIYTDQLPENFEIERSANISPLKFPIYVNSQLGYKLLYLLGDFDILARSVMTAAHIALMTRDEARDWLEAGAKLIRQIFGFVGHYRHSGITRSDAKVNNARYQDAIKRMGYELPPEILSGSVRANFAPNIRESELILDDEL